MNRLLPVILALLTFCAALTGCKTNENNYRKAYQRAKEKETAGLDSTIYNKIRNEAQHENMIIAGDTISMVSEFITVTKDQDVTLADLFRYNIVAARFKQVFHARSMVDRLAGDGYSGAFVVQTREPLYYVVVLSTPDAIRARETLDALAANPPFKLQEGMPMLLRAPNR